MSQASVAQLVVADYGGNNPLVSHVSAELMRGESKLARRVLKTSAAEGPAREFYFQAIAYRLTSGAALDAWRREEPDNPDAWLLSGAYSIHKAWENRGGGLGADVLLPDRELFEQGLSRAADELMRAAELNPDDALPYALLIHVMRGLSVNENKALGAFDEAKAREPSHLTAHRAMLIYFAAKWLGSHEDMFEMARGASYDEPPGSLVPSIMARAHIERWSYMLNFDKLEDQAARYFGKVDVCREVLWAYDRCFGGEPPEASPMVRLAAGDFAFCLAQMGEKVKARKMFDIIGNYPDDYPWYYLGVAAQQYTSARNWVLAPG